MYGIIVKSLLKKAVKKVGKNIAKKTAKTVGKSTVGKTLKKLSKTPTGEVAKWVGKAVKEVVQEDLENLQKARDTYRKLSRNILGGSIDATVQEVVNRQLENVGYPGSPTQEKLKKYRQFKAVMNKNLADATVQTIRESQEVVQNVFKEEKPKITPEDVRYYNNFLTALYNHRQNYKNTASSGVREINKIINFVLSQKLESIIYAIKRIDEVEPLLNHIVFDSEQEKFELHLNSERLIAQLKKGVQEYERKFK